MTHEQRLIKGWLDWEQGIKPIKKNMTKRDKQVIFRECSTFFNLKDKKRDRQRSYMRFFLYQKMRENFFSLTEIAEVTGRDHSTVIYGIDQHNIFKNDKEYIGITKDVSDWLKNRIIND